MLYLFYGTDRNKALEKALGIIDKKLEEKKDAMVFKVDPERLTRDLLVELSGGQGLFEQKYIVHLKDVMSDEASKDAVLGFLKDIQESDNVFIWTDGAILKKDLTKIEKHADKMWEHVAKEKTEEKQNIFGIANYLQARDKKNLWIEYQKLREDFVPEEIHGTLFWAMKNIALAAVAKDAAATGLKPFVYSNAKKAMTRYSPDEIKDRLWSLTKMLGDSRRGEGELDVLLERWVLGI